jgi:hypothetical protein
MADGRTERIEGSGFDSRTLSSAKYSGGQVRSLQLTVIG